MQSNFHHGIEMHRPMGEKHSYSAHEIRFRSIDLIHILFVFKKKNIIKISTIENTNGLMIYSISRGLFLTRIIARPMANELTNQPSFLQCIHILFHRGRKPQIERENLLCFFNNFAWETH